MKRPRHGDKRFWSDAHKRWIGFDDVEPDAVILDRLRRARPELDPKALFERGKADMWDQAMERLPGARACDLCGRPADLDEPLCQDCSDAAVECLEADDLNCFYALDVRDDVPFFYEPESQTKYRVTAEGIADLKAAGVLPGGDRVCLMVNLDAYVVSS